MKISPGISYTFNSEAAAYPRTNPGSAIDVKQKNGRKNPRYFVRPKIPSFCMFLLGGSPLRCRCVKPIYIYSWDLNCTSSNWLCTSSFGCDGGAYDLAPLQLLADLGKTLIFCSKVELSVGYIGHCETLPRWATKKLPMVMMSANCTALFVA